MKRLDWALTVGDCRDILRGLESGSVDACVTDPPYLLGFMGAGWDAAKDNPAADVELWREVLRVLKPGGHLLAFGAPRTYHRVACAIEDAGFEVRDSLHWVFGQGFPKSLNVSKAIDKAAGAEREVVGATVYAGGRGRLSFVQRSSESIGFVGRDPEDDTRLATAPATEAALHWDGWGTALKPAHEPIILARKPFAGTVAANVQEHGTGALNIDACRVEVKPSDFERLSAGVEAIRRRGGTMANSWKNSSDLSGANPAHPAGRWPPNLLLTHSPDCTDDACADDCPVREMGEQSGTRPSDSGTAARYFPTFRYQAKASKSDRGEGNDHPTVKPVALMQWLVRLVTPPGGLVLDPFAGSGTTGVACAREGFRFLGLELSEHYADIARRRIEHQHMGTLVDVR